MWIRRALVPTALLACTLSGSPAPAQPAPAPTATARTAAPQAAAAARPAVTKLLVFVEENHSLRQMRTGMPYTFGLAKRYGYATDYRALTHPSLPNYIAVAGGRMYGISNDRGPDRHRLTGQSVFGQAIRHHRSTAVYADGMPGTCALSNRGRYAVRHNPWTYFSRERASCRRHDRSMAGFVFDVRAGRLPRVGMVVPDLCHDAHDCGLATADAWFKSVMRRILAGPDWRSGRLAVVLTADEDDRTDGNRVLTTVIHRSQHSHVVRSRLNHYSLTRLYDEVAELPYLGAAASAPSIATAFGLPVR
jgi:hypothetical protein